MSHTSSSKIHELLSEHCAAFVLVAVNDDGEAQVHVQESGLALSLAVANARLRRAILPQDILRMQAILGELDRAHTPRPAARGRKTRRSTSASPPSPSTSTEETTPSP